MDGLYFSVGWAERNCTSLFSASYAGARYAGKRGPARWLHAIRLWRAMRYAGVTPGVSTIGDETMDRRLREICTNSTRA